LLYRKVSDKLYLVANTEVWKMRIPHQLCPRQLAGTKSTLPSDEPDWIICSTGRPIITWGGGTQGQSQCQPPEKQCHSACFSSLFRQLEPHRDLHIHLWSSPHFYAVLIHATMWINLEDIGCK
jgi:hypothetical protein